jgi:hypothetical protein
MNGFERVFVDVGKGIAWPFKHVAKIIEYLDTVLKDEPVVKKAVIGLIMQSQTLLADGAAAATGDGLNVKADMSCVSAAETLFGYVKNTFLPAIEKAYGDFVADSLPDPASDPVPAVTITEDALPASPGLHTVVPA